MFAGNTPAGASMVIFVTSSFAETGLEFVEVELAGLAGLAGLLGVIGLVGWVGLVVGYLD